MSQLVKLYTARPPGKGDFQILKLQNANATEAAKALDEAFNGPKQPATPADGGGGGRGGMFGHVRRRPGPRRRPTRRPTASASWPTRRRTRCSSGRRPLDMLSIRDLLYNALDPDETDPRGQIRTYRIKVKYGSADRDRELAQGRVQGADRRDAAADRRAAASSPGSQPPAQDQSTRKPAALSVGVDDRTNSLIVATSEGLYKDIKRMVEEIDEAVADLHADRQGRLDQGHRPQRRPAGHRRHPGQGRPAGPGRHEQLRRQQLQPRRPSATPRRSLPGGGFAPSSPGVGNLGPGGTRRQPRAADAPGGGRAGRRRRAAGRAAAADAGRGA